MRLQIRLASPRTPPGPTAPPRPAGLPASFPVDVQEPHTEDEREVQGLQRQRGLLHLEALLHAEGGHVQIGFLHAGLTGCWTDALVLTASGHLEHWQHYTSYQTVTVLSSRQSLLRLPDQYAPALRQRGLARPYDYRLAYREPGGRLAVQADHQGFVALRPFGPDGRALPDQDPPGQEQSGTGPLSRWTNDPLFRRRITTAAWTTVLLLLLLGVLLHLARTA